jgi:CheY-like chemotaxis protein
VEVEPVRVAQILTNLLTNAAKYSTPGAGIVLTAGAGGGAAEELVLSVRDAGVGMTQEQIAHAFELFAQFSPGVRRADSGLGIGLALVRGIAVLHGGDVEARSGGPGQGSEFVVRLPLPVRHEAAAVPEEPSTPPFAQDDSVRRVLVVDDNVDAATMLATFLELSGHRTELAYTGADAVAAAARFQPDVLLLDIGLPDITGYEVARQVRALPDVGQATLVAVTGWGQAQDRQRAREAGFDLHLVKPADPEDVLRLLAAAPPRGRPPDPAR